MTDFLKRVAANPGAAAKSALTTVLAVAAVLAFASQYVTIPVEVVVWLAGAATILRTLVVALNPKDSSYGLGS